MLNKLKELPEEKEKRILVSGEGQEALLVTYYLSRHKRLLSEVPNLGIYLVHKRENPDVGEIEDVDASVNSMSRVGFWLRLATHRLS